LSCFIKKITISLFKAFQRALFFIKNFFYFLLYPFCKVPQWFACKLTLPVTVIKNTFVIFRKLLKRVFFHKLINIYDFEEEVFLLGGWYKKKFSLNFLTEDLSHFFPFDGSCGGNRRFFLVTQGMFHVKLSVERRSLNLKLIILCRAVSFRWWLSLTCKASINSNNENKKFQINLTCPEYFQYCINVVEFQLCDARWYFVKEQTKEKIKAFFFGNII
jgi:hypothetical protein